MTSLATLAPDELEALLAVATPDEVEVIRAGLEAELREQDAWHPLPHQVPPEGGWRYWGLIGGRGIGKTQSGTAWLNDELSAGVPQRARIIAPTLGDARESCVDGVSGLLAHNSLIKFNRSLLTLTWPNGSRCRLFGAHTPDDVERLRAGGNSGLDVYEELAAWRMLNDAWEQADFGLRLGVNPRAVIMTTPKPRPRIKWLLRDGETHPERTVITRASTRDNPHLHHDVRARLEETYGGTRLGRQELEGELIDDIEGALWQTEWVEATRLEVGEAPGMRRIVVAVDPSWGSGRGRRSKMEASLDGGPRRDDDATGDECGIVVAGLGFDKRGYVLEDASLRGSPEVWGQAVKAAYERWAADRILAEVNFQAEQVRLVMKTVDPALTFKEVRVSRGKQLRAEPIAALYEQGKISHVGRFPHLERQLTEWVPGESDFSPDRVDAACFALSELMLGPATGSTSVRPTGALPKVGPYRGRARGLP